MELILRALVIYGALLLLTRISGPRQLSEATTFDVALIVVVAEATGNALVGEDYSVTAAVVVMAVLIAADTGLSFMKNRFGALERLMEGKPVILINRGQLEEDTMKRERIDNADILQAARREASLERLAEIKYAILEKNGAISVIPWKSGGGG